MGRCGRASGANQRGAGWRSASPTSPAVSLLGLLGLALLALAQVVTTPVARAAGVPTMNILVPTPSNGATEGPPGANVSIRAQALNAGATYQLGYAQHDIGCTLDFHAITGATAAATSDGSLTATFTWPSDVNNVGTRYNVCLRDTKDLSPTNVPVQSTEYYLVDAQDAPQFTFTPAPDTTGTPTPTAQSGGFYSGANVTITGRNFMPGGKTLLAVLTSSPLQDPAYIEAAKEHSLSQGGHVAKITASVSGDFTVVVTLPTGLKPATTYYLGVVSNDGGPKTLPSLLVYNSLPILAPPTPTATVPTVVTPTTSAHNPDGSPSPSANNVGQAFVLGGLSLVLFVVGVILLASASGASRPGR